MEYLQTLTIAYECESSLGNSLNIKEMTREFLRIFLKKTSAIYATINELDNENTFPLNSVGKDEFYKLTIDAKPNNIDRFSIVNIVHNEITYRSLYVLLDDYYLAFVYSQKNQMDIEVIANIFYSLKNKIELGIKACKEHERLELALIGSNNGIWDWNLEDNSVYFSPRWKEMLGYSDNELKHELTTWKERVHSDDLESALKGLQENIDGKTDYYEGIHRLKHKDGSWVWILDRGKAIFDKDSKAVRMIGTHTDITKQKNMELAFFEQQKEFKAIYDGSKDGIALLDEKSNFLQVNPAYIKMTGMSEEELLATSCIALSAPEDVERSIEVVGIVLKTGYIKNYEKRCHVKDGTYIDVNMSISLLENPTRLLISVRDVTQQKKTEIDLAIQYNLLQTIVDTVPVRIFWKDIEGIYLGANKLFLADAQLNSLDDIIGKNDYDMPWGSTEAQLYRDDDLIVMNNDIPKISFEETQTDDDGNQIILLTSKIPLKDEKENIIGVLGSYADITKQRNIEKELIIQKDALSYQANHDELTGLANRTLFNDRLRLAIEKANRNKHLVALLFIDLDHFKEINDSLGHDVGDLVLQEVTNRFNNVIRNDDSVARLGGDEFTVILEDLKNAQDASLAAQKILKSLSEPFILQNNKLYISSSIGISIYPDNGISVQNLLKFADSAMYKAKDEGRNNFQYYSADMTELAFERVVMETSLRAALSNEEFVVYYQPQVDGRNNKVIGMEALIRWQHPTMGLVSPAKFIPLAESTGLIVEVDRYVMKIAMTQIVEWYSQGLNPGLLAMNLAVKQLQEEDFISMFKNLMQEINCKPEWLELEVTEGQIMTNPEKAIVILQKISDLGVELAVDDFGTGYSSLAYLKRLPIDKLKIDQAFVRDLPGDEEDEGITKAIIALSKSLNLKVIAEGVETKEQRDFIVENGCENIQGYFYSKPVPADEFEEILRNGF